MKPFEQLKYWKYQDYMKGFNEHIVYSQIELKNSNIKEIIDKARDDDKKDLVVEVGNMYEKFILARTYMVDKNPYNSYL